MKQIICAMVLAVSVLACGAANGRAAGTRTLTWGGDSEGGAPYVFQDPRHPERVIGFEVDIAKAMGQLLHRHEIFVQNEWDGLIPALQRGDYDMAMNGIEITPRRAKVVAFSIPYYACSEQLSVRKANSNIHGLADLKGKIVGTLKDSLAERILQKAGGIHIRSYDGQINAYEDLADGRLNAVLMDEPIAAYYGKPLAALKYAGKPIGRMEYVIAFRPGDVSLLGKVNQALLTLIKNGTLRQIYLKWGMWNTATRKLFAHEVVAGVPPAASELSRFTHELNSHKTFWQRAGQYWSYVPILLEKGAPMTLAISLVSMAVAVSLGLLLALLKLYAPAPLSLMARAYIELVRGTPLLIQLYLIFYGLPNVGIKLSPFVAAIVGLGGNYAAYEAENYRAGLQAISAGQMEAALSLGMTRLQALRHVIVPQAFRAVIPPVTNDFISLFKDSSIVSVITLVELTKVYGELASTYYDYIGIGLITAAIYFVMGMPFVYLARRLEKHMAGVGRPLHAGGKPLNAA